MSGDCKGAIEAGAVILPADRSGEFDKLRLTEFAAQFVVKFVCDGCRSFAEGHSETEREPFGVAKGIALFKAG
jgi:hypothetical protein